METKFAFMGKFDRKAAVEAGVIAGAIFLLLELFMVPIFAGGSPWGPTRMIAAIVLGQGVLPPPATFDLGIVAAALGVHFVLAIVYGLVFGAIIGRMHIGPALLVGFAGGLALYLVNFYGFTAIFPWFVEARNWITIFTHLVFGLSTAGSYVLLARAHAGETRGTTPMTHRPA